MRRASLLPLLLLPSALALGCAGKTSDEPHDAGPDVHVGVGDDASPPENEGGSDSGGLAVDGGPHPDDGSTITPPGAPANKVDILFDVQNSASMVGIGPYVQASVQALFDRLLTPNCVDAKGNVVGVSSAGACASGALEFQPVTDIHVGLLTTSLGGRGGSVCPATATDPTNSAVSAHNDDQGQLIDRTGAAETALGDASPSGFLAWFPTVAQNAGKPSPPVPAIGQEAQLVSDFQGMLADTGLHGCGFTAPLESWYRFLVQPDPYASIAITTNVAKYSGVDATILQQRHDFLRADSTLAVILVASEDDRSADPLNVGGQGWAFENNTFPGSASGTAPEGSIECKTAPESAQCQSCAFIAVTDPSFATRCPSDPPDGLNGYLDPEHDQLNVRFFHMKQRFGIDPQFPIARYVSGLTSPTVPDSAHEHDINGNYVPSANCVNPIFAATLPTSATSELCTLPKGTRSAAQVFFTVIGGVPHQLLQQDPTNANSPQKAALTATDWNTILGADPLNYDFTGADFHMLESEDPRTASSCGVTGADNCDPINGREWATNQGDLQFACTFTLLAPLDCSQAANQGACACETGGLEASTQLCQKDGTTGKYTQTQLSAGVYPSIRPLSVARGLGTQGVVSSLCPIHVAETAPGDPLFAYRPAFNALVDRMGPTLLK